MKKVTMSTIKPAKVYTDEGKTYLAFYVGSDVDRKPQTKSWFISNQSYTKTVDCKWADAIRVGDEILGKDVVAYRLFLSDDGEIIIIQNNGRYDVIDNRVL